MSSRTFHMQTSCGRLVFLAIAIDFIVREGASRSISAQADIWTALIVAVFILLLAQPVLRAQDGDARHLLLRAQTRADWALCAFAALTLCFSCACTALRAEQYYRTVSDEPLNMWLVVVLLLAAAFYAAHCGVDTLTRASSLVLCLFLGSIALLILANISNAKWENLTLTEDLAQGVLQSVPQNFYLPAEFLLLCIWHPQNEEKRHLEFAKLIAALLLLFIVFTVFTQLALGGKMHTLLQPAHTLARIGSLSVLKRLDAVHTGVWMLCEAVKLAALFCGAQELCGRLVPKRYEKMARFGALLVVVVFAGIISGTTIPARQMVLTGCVTLFGVGCVCVLRKGARCEEKI